MPQRGKPTMKLCLAQMDVVAGRPEENLRRMLAFMERARAARCALVVFPEMAIPGYFVGDEWDRPSFLDNWGHV